jgi:hypothetical protein
MKTFFKCIALMVTPALIASCASNVAPYDLNRSATSRMGDEALRYGSIAGAGTGGYFLGQSVLGGTAGGALGAAGGVGLAYAANKYVDKKRMDAFNAGREVGAEEAREELLNDKWQREAIYGLPPDGKGSARAASMRNVYVPSRTENGVTLQGGEQQVMLP